MITTQKFFLLLIGIVMGASLIKLTQQTNPDTLNVVCAMMNEAVNNELLSTDQVSQLGQYSAAEMKQKYPYILNEFSLDQIVLNKKIPDPVCDQFLVQVNLVN